METLLVPATASQTIPGTRVLALVPHPDDEVLGCGGAIMRHVAQGIPVHVIVWTDGGWGVPPAERAAYVEQRRNESRAAAQILGYGAPEFRAHRDRELRYAESLVQEVLAAIEAAGADLVYAPSVLEMHPDHRALALAAVEAVRRRGKDARIALYEIGIPLRPNLLLDITDLAARKHEAMQCFTSQLARQRYDLDVAGLNRYRSFTLPPEIVAAEAYVVVTGAELAQDPLGLFRSEHARQRALGLSLDGHDLPLVSVIVRSMDRASLSDALDSIALQTYPNVEVVVVNAKGAPHRALGEWCGPYPLRLVEPGKPLDRSAAANCGLDAARGELLMFLDDDDLFLPHHIHRLHEELGNHADAVAAYAGVVVTDASGKELRHYAAEFDPLRLTVGNFIPIHAVLFRRAVLARGARFDESLPVCEDWDFWLQLQQQGSFRFVRETGAVYRIQADAGSGVWADEERNREVILRIYRKRLPHLGDKVLWGIFQWAHHKPLYDELTQTHEQLNLQLAAVHREHGVALADYERALADYKNALAGLETHTAWADTRIADLDALHLMAHARIDDLDALRRALEQKIAGLEAEKTAADVRAANQRDALSVKDAMIADLVQRQKGLELVVSERDQRIANIYGSTSWRITRPLRGLVTLFRKKNRNE